MGRAQISGRLWYAFPLGIPQDYLNIFEIHSNPANEHGNRSKELGCIMTASVGPL